jgi:hypothetical protein
MNEELRSAIVKHAQRIGANPVDLANVISYETGGTFDPWQNGPTTQWGKHKGFIQMGEPQRQQYGYTEGKSVDDLVGASADYLVGNGYKGGMGMLDMYSIINAGAPGKYNASDADNGGAPGTVADKVNVMMGQHRQKALDLLGPGFSGASTNYAPAMAAPTVAPVEAPTNISPGVKASPVDTTMVFENMPAQPYSAREQYVRDTMEVNDSPEITLMDGIGAAVDSNWSAAWALKESKTAGIDTSFIGQVKADAYKELSAGIPAEYQDALIAAQSLAEMEQAQQIAKGQMENDRVLASFGWGGVALNIGAAILDPVAIGAAVATEGAMAPVIAAAKFGRIGRIAASAFNAGVSNAAAEAAVGIWSPRVTQQTIAESFGIGMVLGGAFGALGRNPALSDEAAAMVAQGRAMGAGSAGAAEIPGRMEQKVFGSLVDDLFEGDVSRAFADTFRPDVVGRLSASGDDAATLLGRYLAQESTGINGDEIVEVSASIRKKMLQHSTMHVLESKMKPSYGSWLQKNSKRHGDDSWVEFNDLVSEYRDNLDPAYRLGVADEIKEANKAYDEFYDRFQKLANNPGVERGEVLRAIPGFAEEKINYRPMYSDVAAIHRILKEIGEGGMIRVVRRAIVDAVDDLEEDLIDRMATGYVTRLNRIGYGSSMGIDEVLSRGDKDEMYMFLMNDMAITDEDAARRIADKLYSMQQRTNNKSPTSRGMRRTSINYHLKTPIGDKEYAVRDFFIKDAHTSAKRYADEMSGHIALGQMVVKNPKTGKVLVDGVTTKAEWQKVIDQVTERMVRGGSSPKHVQQTIERLNYLYDHITGKPRLGEQANRSWAAWVRRGASLQFMRLMQNMGITQAQELANITAGVGLKAFFQGVPAFGRILDKSRRPIPVKRMVTKTRPKMVETKVKSLNPDPAMVPKTEIWHERSIDANGNEGDWVQKDEVIFDENGKPVMVPDPEDEWIETTEIKQDGVETYQEEVPDYDPALGPYKDQVVQELMAVTGEGYDNYLHQFRYHHIDDAMGETFGEGKLDKLGNAFDKVAPMGKRIVSNISLMRHVNTTLHQWAMRAIAQKMANLAFKHAEKLKTGKFKLEDINGFLTGRDADRFKLLGLDSEKTKMIFNEMLKKADGAATGSRLSALNLDQWDPKARAAFVEALYQWTGRTIQSNDVGNLAMWMTNPIAQLMFQFRSFVFGAYAKQTLHGIRHMDGRTMANLTLQMGAAAGIWYLQSKFRSFGAKDPDQYMEDRAGWDDLAKAAVARAGISSVLPMFYDQAMGLGLDSPVAALTGASKADLRLDFRTSGTPTSGLMSITTLNHIDDLSIGLGSVSDALVDGRNLSQSEWNRLLRGTLGNHIGLTTGLSYLVQDLPKNAPKE